MRGETPIVPVMRYEQRLAHDDDQIDRTIAAFVKIGRKHGVIA